MEKNIRKNNCKISNYDDITQQINNYKIKK